MEGADLGVKGGVMGEIRVRGGRENCSRDVMYERIKIIKKI